MIRPVNPRSMSPFLHFFGSEMSSLVRSNALWDSTMVNTALYKFTDGSLGRNITRRDDKFLPRITVHSNKDKVLPLS